MRQRKLNGGTGNFTEHTESDIATDNRLSGIRDETSFHLLSPHPRTSREENSGGNESPMFGQIDHKSTDTYKTIVQTEN